MARKLRQLGFEVVTTLGDPQRLARGSEQLVIGKVYTRAELMRQFDIRDATRG